MFSRRSRSPVASLRILACTISLIAAAASAARAQQVLTPQPMSEPVVVDDSSGVVEESSFSLGGFGAHLGCGCCGGCGGPYCPYRKPQPTLGEKRAEVASQSLDWARPQSIIRLHFDAMFDLEHPDRATYF